MSNQELEERLKIVEDRLESLELFVIARPQYNMARLDNFLMVLERIRVPLGYGLAAIGFALLLITMTESSRDQVGKQLLTTEAAATIISVVLGVRVGSVKVKK